MVPKMSISETEKECPLCMEALDWDDLGFYPCSCGYQICRFCWHRLKTDENGLCPACRQTFPDIPVSFNPDVSAEELKKQKKRNKERHKTNKEQVVKAQDLATLRVVQKNLVFVIGLSSRLTQEDLKKEFAHFGKIIKFVHNKSTAYVTYSKPEEAIRAIRTLNASAAQESASQHLQLQQLTNGTNNIITTGPTGTTTSIVTNPISVPVPPNRLKASLGTTKYCNHFLRSQQCPKVGECMYLHEIAEAEASFTKEQMQAGKHVEYEKKLMDSYFVKPEIPNNNNNNNNVINNTNNSNNLIRQQPQIAMHNQQQLPVTHLPNQQSQQVKPNMALSAVASSNSTVSKSPETMDVFKESNPCGDPTAVTTTASAPIASAKAWMSTTISSLNTNSNSNSSSGSSSSSSGGNNISNSNNNNNNNNTTFHQSANEENNIFKRSPLLQPGKSFQSLHNETLNTLFSSNINGFDTVFHEKICGINTIMDMNNLDGHPLQQHEKTTARSLKSNNTLESPFLSSLDRLRTEQTKQHADQQSTPIDIDSEDDGLDFDPISVSTIGLRDMLMDQQVQQQQQALHNTMSLTNQSNHRLNHTNSILDFDSQSGSATLEAALGLAGGNHGLSQQQQQQVTWQNLRNLFPNVNITFNARPMNQTSNQNEFSHHQSYLMPTSAASSGDPWPSQSTQQGTANSMSAAGQPNNMNHNHDFFSLAPNSHDEFGSLANSHNINSTFNVLHATSQPHRDRQQLLHQQQQQQRYLRHVSSNTGSNNQSSNMNDPCLTSSVWHSRNN